MGRLWALILLCGILLSGCIRVPSLQELAVVQGVAADYADGRYELTLQLFSAEGSGGQTVIDPSKQNAQTISCSGETVAEALSQTSLSQGRSFFLGHDRLLILGEGTRELELSVLLGELKESLGLREDVIVLAADGKAADLLCADINQGVLPAMTVEQTVKNAAKEGKIPETRLLELERTLRESHRSAVIPTVSVSQHEEELKTFLLSGAALYANDGYRGKLEGDALSGLLFFEDRVEAMGLTAGGKSVRLYRCRTKLIPEFDGSISFLLKIDAKGMLQTSAKSVSDEEREKLELLLEQRITECCGEVFDLAVKKARCDILGMGDVVWRQQPELFRTLQEDWEDTMGDIRVEYRINAVIDRFAEG